MRLKSSIAAAVAATLATAPVVAQAATTEVDQARAGAQVEGENLRGGFLLPLAVLVALILGIILLTDGDSPESP